MRSFKTTRNKSMGCTMRNFNSLLGRRVVQVNSRVLIEKVCELTARFQSFEAPAWSRSFVELADSFLEVSSKSNQTRNPFGTPHAKRGHGITSLSMRNPVCLRISNFLHSSSRPQIPEGTPCIVLRPGWTSSSRWSGRTSVFLWRLSSLAKGEIPARSTWGRSQRLPNHHAFLVRFPNGYWY